MLSENFWNSTIRLNIDNSPVLLIREFFDKEVSNRVYTECNELLKDQSVWEKLDLQTQLPRKVFQGAKSNTFLEIIEHFNTESFLKKFSTFTGQKINSLDFNLWWDTEGYTLPMHIDNDKVKLSMQIYVGELEHNTLGTSFGDSRQNLILTLPYRSNTGYFLANPNRIQHGLISTVPSNFNRLSLYFYIT